MAKKKAKIDKDGYVTFLNDDDGFSAKDYLLLISTVIFFGFITIGPVLILCGISINEDYMKLLEMVDTPLMVIISAVTGSNMVQYVTDKKSVTSSKETKNKENEYSEEEI